MIDLLSSKISSKFVEHKIILNILVFYSTTKLLLLTSTVIKQLSQNDTKLLTNVS